MAPVVTGTLHFLRHYNFSANADLGVDPNHNILFESSWDYKSYKYQPDGTTILVDTETPGVWKGYGCTVDTTRHFVFFGGAVGRVYCYSYDNAGNMTYVDKVSVWFSNGVWDITVDTDYNVLVVGAGNVKLATITYDDFGHLTMRADLRWTAIIQRCGIDSYRNIAFSTGGFPESESYTYNNLGLLGFANTMPVGVGTNIIVDSDAIRRFGYFGSGTDIIRFTYDADGTNLAINAGVSADPALGTIWALDLDRINFLLFTAQWSGANSGISSLRYNPLTGIPTLIDSDVGGKQGWRLTVDNINHLIFASGGTLPSGLDIYSYDVKPAPPAPPQDSWGGLSRTTDRFTKKPNWIQASAVDFDYNRELIEFSGTQLDIYRLSQDAPFSLSYKFTNLSREDEYYIANFFCEHRGKHKRFWIPLWKNMFTLINDIANGDGIITIPNVGFHLIDRGYERIFIELKNGYQISRKVTAVLADGLNENLILDTNMDRVITQDDIKYFSRLLLVRFNDDGLQTKYKADSKSEIELTFYELTNEYELEVES